MRRDHCRKLAQGETPFPILLAPRCLTSSGFVPDCDAVYPASSVELSNYARNQLKTNVCKLFYKDNYIFGFSMTKEL